MGQVQGDVEVPETLLDVSRQSGRSGFHLIDPQDFRAFEGQPAGHDEADVAGAQNDTSLRGHLAAEVDEVLGRAGREDAGGTGAVDGDLLRGPFPAAGGEHHGLCRNGVDAFPVDDDGLEAVRGLLHVRDEGLEQRRDAAFLELVDEPLGVLRAGEFFLEPHEAEAVVDTLFQDAAEALLPFDEEHVRAGVVGGDGRCQSGRTSSDDEDVTVPVVSHAAHLLSWVRRTGRLPPRTCGPRSEGCPRAPR